MLGSPRFRYIDTAGVEQQLSDIAELALAIREGQVVATTLLFDYRLKRWLTAEQHDAFQGVAATNHLSSRLAAREPEMPQSASLEAGRKGSQLQEALSRLEADYRAANAQGLPRARLHETIIRQLELIRKEYDVPVEAINLALRDPDMPRLELSRTREIEPPKKDAEAAEAHSTAVNHPWRRYWARWIDSSIGVIGFALVLGFLAPALVQSDETGYRIGFFGLMMWIVVEAALISKTGTTPGKALLSIRVTGSGGSLLSFDRALNRAVRAWFFGLGAGIPIVALFTCLAGYRSLKDTGRASWDVKTDARVAHRPLATDRVVVAVLLIAGVLTLAITSRAS